MEHIGGIIGVKKLLRGEPGTTLAINLKRGDDQREVSLKLRDLYN